MNILLYFTADGLGNIYTNVFFYYIEDNIVWQTDWVHCKLCNFLDYNA